MAISLFSTDVAIAEFNTSPCQIPEHVHTNDCYRIPGKRFLPCSPKIHEHTAACYDTNGNVLCGYCDQIIHEHDMHCYDDDGSLICVLPEVYSHIHNDSCYTEEFVLICEGGSVEKHNHCDDCYELTENYVCGHEDDSFHVHSSECVETTEGLICGFSDTSEHIHNKDCYQKRKVLICRKPELIPHVHNIDCYSEGILSCGLLQTIEHQHNIFCFKTGEDIITDEPQCGLVEHIHAAACKGQEKEDTVLTSPPVMNEECKEKEKDLSETDDFPVHEGKNPIDSNTSDYNLSEFTCGIPEHTHTSNCYLKSKERKLICHPEVHKHSELCYDADGNVVCGNSDQTIHKHDSFCYDKNNVLVCNLPEVLRHTHDDSCYKEEFTMICKRNASRDYTNSETYEASGISTCGLDEDESYIHTLESFPSDSSEHTHDESCYLTKKVLICGKSELTPHIHGADCYSDDGTLICDLPQIAEHQHTDACFDENELVMTSEPQCGINEHTHTTACKNQEKNNFQLNEILCVQNFSEILRKENLSNGMDMYMMKQPEAYNFDFSTENGFGVKTVTIQPQGFTESAKEIKNPNRGFYHISQFTITDNDSHSDYQWAVNWGCDQGPDFTIKLVEINLQNYRDGDITEKGIANIDVLLNLWAKTGRQLIIRFVYDYTGNNLNTEPETIDVILRHMEQIGPILQKYESSIFTLQGLFIGDYGEMHDTKYGTDDDLRCLAQKLASVTGSNMRLAVRTPAQWRIVTSGGTDPVLINRLGLFNDGMLGSESDLGTYDMAEQGVERRTREEELAFQEKLCARVPNGGQVVNVWNVAVKDNTYNDFENAVQDLSSMHVSYLDWYWQQEVLNKWAASTVTDGGCFNGMDGLSYISRHLGYRLLIDDTSSYQQSSSQEIDVSVNFRNVGFAPLYESPELTLILKKDNNTVHTYQMEHCLTALSGGHSASETESAQATISVDDLTDGVYSLYINLKDSDSQMPILLANEQERSENGYLLGTVTILSGKSVALPNTGGMGSEMFFNTGFTMILGCSVALIKRCHKYRRILTFNKKGV